MSITQISGEKAIFQSTLKNLRQIGIWVAIAAALALITPSWGQSPPSPAPQAEEAAPKIDYSRYGGTLTVAIPPVVTLDSQLASGFSSQLLINNIQEGLFNFNREQELLPVLASAPPQMEDELNYLLYLREGVYFHDGSEFEAEAVVYTIERLLNPDTGAPLQPYFAGQIKSAEVVDKHTVRVKLAKAHIDVGALFSRLELYPLSPKSVAEYGAEYGKVIAVGTGPFAFAEWVRDEKIVLRRFGRYLEAASARQAEAIPQDKAVSEAQAAQQPNPCSKPGACLPYLNILQFRFHASEGMGLVDLQTRRLSVLGGISPATARQSRSRYIKIQHQPGLLLEQIYLNLKRAPFNNKLVRMALAYGLDRQAIADEVFGEYATPAKSLFPPWHWVHNADYQGLGYHPQIARQLLKQAGYTQSNPLRFELLCTAESQFIAQAESAVKQWEELGVKAKVTPLDKGELMSRLYGRGGGERNFSAALEDWQGGINLDLFAYDLYSPASPYNKVLYNNPLIELLFYDARSSRRREEQAIFYHQIEKLITADVSTIYLSFPHNIWAYNRYVEGLKPDYRGLVDFSRVWFPH